MGNVCGSDAKVDEPTPKAAPAAAAVPEPAVKPAATTEPVAAAAAAAPPAPVEQAAAAVPAAAEQAAGAGEQPAAATKPTKIFVIYYSTYGHIRQLAAAYHQVLSSIPGVEATLYQVPEILSEDVLAKMHAPPKASDPVIDAHTLDQADAFVFGFPTRFGMMASQMKQFFDATGGHWQKGALHGKPASMFTSTATQGGGQETTLMTAVTQLAHHGIIYVPAGYAAGGAMFGVETAKGGSPWGAGTLAGPDGSRQPAEVELEALRVQAKYFGEVAKKLSA